jgi:putative transposase
VLTDRPLHLLGKLCHRVLAESPVGVIGHRDSSFGPEIVARRQRRLTMVEMVISQSARGLIHGEISAHLAEIYGAEVSKQTITAITGW